MGDLLKTEFLFGRTKVRIIEGNILAPGVEVEALVSSDDNYLTMGSGVSRRLAEQAGLEYVREAQAQTPVRVGTVVATGAHSLPEHGLNVRCVLHGAVIDYDTYDLPLEEVVYRVTGNCLQQAEALGLKSMLFPAFATGAGKLAMESCAQQMCGAMKAFLAHERPLNEIYILLYLRQDLDGQSDPAEVSRNEERKKRNERYIREANLVLGVPYNPATNVRQTRDFYGREQTMQRLQAILAGDRAVGRHAVILGGSRIGKSALLDWLYYEARLPGGSLGEDRALARVTFGRVHERTPTPFIYRKLLNSLGEGEENPGVREAIRRAYADTAMNGERFESFLEKHFPKAVFLIDHLERLLRMGAEDFWRDLERLGGRARFIFTATEDHQYESLSERLPDGFKSGLEEIRLKCVEVAERRTWIEAVYQRYLGRNASEAELEFVEEEAGRHPYLISLACHALIDAIKRDSLTNPTHPKAYDRNSLAPFFRSARSAIDGPRQDFYDLLMGAPLLEEDRLSLEKLCEAVAIEEKTRVLVPALRRNDPEALAQLQGLQTRAAELRPTLEVESLRRLEARGYLVDSEEAATAQFVAKSFWSWLEECYGKKEGMGEVGVPRHVELHLDNPEPATILTRLRHDRGPRRLSRRKELHPDLVADFMTDLSNYINHQLRPIRYPDPGVFREIGHVGNFILAQFVTFAIKQYFHDSPRGSTILFEIHDGLKHLPWELLLETAYSDEIPFRIGRVIITEQEAQSLNPPVRGDEKVKALLIGDPTDDLGQARLEVQELADRLRHDDHFEEPDVLIGSDQCRRTPLLNQFLASGKYGLIHYSGHSQFDGYRSAWVLKDGKNIETSMLTNALQNGPPALVFSSSCESGEAAEPQPVKYENQTFDLPSAFLQAGVEAYVGTLWSVKDTEARALVSEFYDALLSGEHDLGECLRLAKWNRKQQGDRINWLAFTLYGDPNAGPGDLFPAFAR